MSSGFEGSPTFRGMALGSVGLVTLGIDGLTSKHCTQSGPAEAHSHAADPSGRQAA